MIGLLPSLLIGQVTKTNSTAGNVNGAQAVRTVNFTGGDLGGCTSLTDIDMAINWVGGAFQVVEQIALSIQSPTGTTVHLVYDTQGTLTGNIGQFPTYDAGGFASWTLVTTTFDDDAGAPIPGAAVPSAGSWIPEEALSAFDGEDATGTWTITISDHTDNTFGDDLSFNFVSVTVSCAAACTDPDVPVITATPSTICPGSSSTLTWTGNLNDATAWHVYTTSCGVTQLTTTTLNTLVVTPGSNTTYFIRGEDGAGCVDESTGLCGSATVIVQDITPPTITCPGGQIGIVNGACNFTIPDYTGLAVVADNCTASPTVTQSPAPGTNVGTGTTVITLTATDGSSNTANCNFNVSVSDITPPTITCPGNQVGSVNGSCNFVLPDYTGLSVASDNCPGITVAQVPVPGTIVGIGTTNVVFTVTDGASNTANCNFKVVISDNTNPTIVCPIDQNESFDATCNFTLPDYTGLAVVADNCNPAPVVTQSPVAGTVISGTTTITLTGNDGSGNTAGCTFDVIPADNTKPTIN